MLNRYQRDAIGPIVRVMQIIWLALTGGTGVYAAVVWFMKKADAEVAEGPGALAYLALAFGAASLVLAVVIPSVMMSAQKRSLHGRNGEAASDEHRVSIVRHLAGAHQVRLIVRCAILEGAAFLNGVAYWVERQEFNFYAMLALIAVMVALFPLRRRLEETIDRQLIAARQEGQWSDR